MSELSIRPATQEDIAAIVQMGRAVIPEVYAPLAGPDYAQGMLDTWWTEVAFRRALDAGHTRLLVAEYAGRIVGMAECEVQEQRAVLWKLYVRPEWRGKGVGRRLLQAVRESLPASTRWLCAEYLTANTPAGEFYRRQGFVFDLLEEDARLAGHSYTWVKMELIQSDAPHT